MNLDMASCMCVRHRSVVRLLEKSVKSFSSSSVFCTNTANETVGTSVIPKSLGPSPPPVSETPSPLHLHSYIKGSVESEAVEDVSSATIPASSQEVHGIGKPVAVDARKVDPTTIRQVYFFDSLGFVKNLEHKGFSRDQAEGLAEALTDIINTTLEHQSRHMITKSQQEITVQQLMAEIVSVKKDMVLLQKSEFSQLCTETEKMGIELSNVKNALKDEVSKLKGHVTLDINLERGRAIEAHAANEAKLQQLHNKIDTDVANLKTVFEQYRNDVLKYAGGTVLTCATLCLGIIRLWN